MRRLQDADADDADESETEQVPVIDLDNKNFNYTLETVLQSQMTLQLYFEQDLAITFKENDFLVVVFSDTDDYLVSTWGETAIPGIETQGLIP